MSYIFPEISTNIINEETPNSGVYIDNVLLKDGSLSLQDASSTNTYNFITSELASNKNIILPILTNDDTLVFDNHTQTLKNKTIDDSNTIDASAIAGKLVSNTEFDYINGLNQNLTTTSNIQFGKINANDTTDSTSISTGSLMTAGGLAVTKQSYFANNINVQFTTGGFTSKYLQIKPLSISPSVGAYILMYAKDNGVNWAYNLIQCLTNVDDSQTQGVLELVFGNGTDAGLNTRLNTRRLLRIFNGGTNIITINADDIFQVLTSITTPSVKVDKIYFNDSASNNTVYLYQSNNQVGDYSVSFPLLIGNDTMVCATTSSTLINKTINAPDNTITNISNANISATASIDVTKLSSGVVDNTEFNYINGLNQNLTTISDVTFNSTSVTQPQGCFMYGTYTTLSDASGGIGLLVPLTEVIDVRSQWTPNAGATDGIIQYTGIASRYFIINISFSISTSSGGSSTLTLQLQSDTGGGYTNISGGFTSRYFSGTNDATSVCINIAHQATTNIKYRILITSTNSLALYTFNNITFVFSHMM